MRGRRMSPSIGSDTDTPFSAQYLQPADQGADALGMESWDEWETEIQERLAELNNEHSSPEPGARAQVGERRSVGVLTTKGVAGFRAFLSRVEARMDPPRAPGLDISNLSDQLENPL